MAVLTKQMTRAQNEQTLEVDNEEEVNGLAP